MTEIKQLLARQSWTPVQKDRLTPAQRRSILPTKMFLKEKFKPSGAFDKLKSRLVAGGHRQDRSLYRDKTSSPTVSTSCVFTIATIAHYERRAVATIDFPGAYLNSDMNTEIYIELDKIMSNLLMQIDKEYTKYLTDEGTIVVLLKKALYYF